MQEIHQVNPQKYHPFFLYFFNPEIENMFHLNIHEFRMRKGNLIFICIFYLLIVVIRLASMIDSILMNKMSCQICEIIWLSLTLVNALVELGFHFFNICSKVKAIPTIVFTSYIVGHSSYIYYCVNKNNNQDFFLYYIISVSLFYLAVGVYLSYSWFSYFISLFVGIVVMLSFIYLGRNSLLLSTKILLSVCLTFIWLGTSYMAFGLENILRYLHYKNVKTAQTTEEMKKFLQIFPNEILIIDNKREIQFINISLCKNFLNIYSQEEIKEYTSFEKISTILQKLKLHENIITFADIMRDPILLAFKYQKVLINFINSLGSNETFTYKCIQIDFNNKKCIAYIFNNETSLICLKNERSASQTKQIMVTQITHDMRIPLNAMICAEENLEEFNLKEEQMEIILTLKNSSEMLLMLVNDSLDLFTKEEKEIIPSCMNFDASKIVEECYNLMKYNFNSKGINLIVNVPEQIPLLFSDGQRFKRIILNLLGNALKFTNIGYVKIKLKYLPEKQIVYCSVRDTGKGITKEDLQRLFARFNKLNDPTNDNPTGLGIGLSVCKTLSLALGGDIRVNSVIGKGSKFSFWIPRIYKTPVKDQNSSEKSIYFTEPKESEISEIIDMEGNKSPKNLRKSENSSRLLLSSSPKNIICENLSSHSKLFKEEEEKVKRKPFVLVVDDEISIINAIESCLKRLKIRSEHCFDGIEAVEKVKKKLEAGFENFYDLIIMDYEMKEMNGIKAIKEMNKLFDLYRVHPKVIISTGDNNSELLNEIALNNAIYVQKPLKYKKIKEIVNEFISIRNN